MNQGGFTLIEMMIVIMILAIYVAIIAPAIMGPDTEDTPAEPECSATVTIGGNSGL